MVSAAVAHVCPGGCGATVPNRLFACRPCWYRLPADIRTAINESWKARNYGAHNAAKAEALEWYEINGGGGDHRG